MKAHSGRGPRCKVYRVKAISPHPEKPDQVMGLAGHKTKLNSLHYLMVPVVS